MVTSLLLSPRGGVATGWESGAVILLDGELRPTRALEPVGKSPITCLGPAAGGRWVAGRAALEEGCGGGGQGLIAVGSFEGGDAAAVAAFFPKEASGVNAVAATGGRVVAGLWSSRSVIIDTATGDEVKLKGAHQGGVRWVEVGEEGFWTAGKDGRVNFWRLA